MIRLHRIVENKNDILSSTDTVRFIQAPPPGWVELDLTGMDTGISQFKSGINRGVYIHRDDLEFIRDVQTGVINYDEILDHSYGNSFHNSLTYKPTIGFTKRVSIPRVLVRKLLSYKYLTSVDSKIEGLGLADWSVYSTGHLGSRPLKMPKRVYEKVSTDQFSEYESVYYSLRDLSINRPFYKKESFPISKIQLLQLLKKFFNGFDVKTRRDIVIATEIRDKLKTCLNKDIVSDIDELQEVFTENELSLDLFSTLPDIYIYKYKFNIYTISDFNFFIRDIMGGVPNAEPYMAHLGVDRGNDLIYIIDTRLGGPTYNKLYNKRQWGYCKQQCI